MAQTVGLCTLTSATINPLRRTEPTTPHKLAKMRIKLRPVEIFEMPARVATTGRARRVQVCQQVSRKPKNWSLDNAKHTHLREQPQVAVNMPQSTAEAQYTNDEMVR